MNPLRLSIISSCRKAALTVITLTALMASVSCHSARQASASSPDTVPPAMRTTAVASRAADSGLRASFAALASTYSTAWTDVKIPITLKLSSPANLKISGTLTMIRNRSIHISLRMLGFEAATLLIDGDSVFATYKLQKRYVAESIPELLKGFPMNVGNLQSLLIGQAFMPGNGIIEATDASRFSLMPAGDADLPDAFLMTPVLGNAHGVEATFIVDGGVIPNLLAISAGTQNANASCIYSGSATTPAGAVTTGCEIFARSSAKQQIEASVDLNFDKARWDSGATVSRPNTRGYTRIPASSLLKALSSF